MNIGEQIFEAMGSVGMDLVDMAAHQRFKNPWKNVLPMAACLAVMFGLGAMMWSAIRQTPIETPTPTPEPTLSEAPTPETEPEPHTGIDWTPMDVPFYIFDPSQTGMGPAKAISLDGQVLVDNRAGYITYQFDNATKEIIAMEAYHGMENLETAYLEVYDFDGLLIDAHREAWGFFVLGDVEMQVGYVDGVFTCTFTRRSDGSLIYSTDTVGDPKGDVFLVPDNINGGFLTIDGQGQITKLRYDRIDNIYAWNNKAYLVYWDEERLYCGLMDGHGNLLAEPVFDEIKNFTPYPSGYAIGVFDHWLNGTNNRNDVIWLETGDIVFSTEYTIEAVYHDYIQVLDDGIRHLLDWDGNIKYTARTIDAIDDDHDGDPEGYLLGLDSKSLYISADGITSVTLNGEVEIISSHTAFQTYQGQQSFISLLNNQPVATPQKYYKTEEAILEEGRRTGLIALGYGNAYDIYREDGTLLIEGISDPTMARGGVFTTEEGLLRWDGTWLYQE